MFNLKKPSGFRGKRVLALGAAVALSLTGAAVALNTGVAHATSTSAVAGTATVGSNVVTQVNFSGLQGGGRYVVISKLVFADTGADAAPWVGDEISAPASGAGSYQLRLPIPATAAGRKVVAFDYIFPANSVATGTRYAPTSIKNNMPPVWSTTDITNAAKSVQVAAVAPTTAPTATGTVTPTATGGVSTGTTAGTTTQVADGITRTDLVPVAAAASVPVPVTATIPESSVAPATDTPGTAGITTKATDKADGDQTVAKDGVIKDVVSFTGLTPNRIYVLATQLFNKTDGVDTGYMKALVFTPTASSGTVEVEIPVPAGLEGKTLVVYQTIYNGSDVLVGKHLDKVEIRAGKQFLVDHKNPNDLEQTVKVPAPPVVLQPCVVSGFVWKDANKDGVMNANEEKVAGVNADLRSIPGNVFPGTILQSTVTDANGFYKFEVPGAQCGRFFVDWNETKYPAGWTGFAGGESDLSPTNLAGGWSLPFTLNAGQVFERLDAGLREPAQTCTVSGYVWKDANNDGIMNDNEEKVPNVTGALADIYTSHFYQTMKTDANGFYKFTVAGPDCKRYYIHWATAEFPAGWTPFAGGESDLRADGLWATWSNQFDLVAGQDLLRWDAGLRVKPVEPPKPVGGTITVQVCDPLGKNTDMTLINHATKKSWSGRPDGTGKLVFSEIPAGTYNVNWGTPSALGVRTWVVNSIDGGWWKVDARLQYSFGSSPDFTFDGVSNKVMQSCGSWLSPLALDLNGNGKIDTSNVADANGAKFDLLGTGSAVESGWVAKGDGLLVTPNADGSVTSIANLFGGALGEGYAKLASFDTNHDGKVSGSELANIKVWVDANNNRISDAGELKPLSAYGITSLSTSFVNAPVADNGNVVVEHGTATKADGSSVVVGDAYFAVGQLNAVNAAALAASSARTETALAGLPVAEAAAIRAAFAGR